MNIDRINELERQIAELKGRWPAHSVPPAMFRQLDEFGGGIGGGTQERNRGTKQCQSRRPW